MSTFSEMLSQEMRASARDFSEHLWLIEEPYWRKFSRWPWWRQAWEVMVMRSSRRLIWHACRARKDLMCRLGRHDLDTHFGWCSWCGKEGNDGGPQGSPGRAPEDPPEGRMRGPRADGLRLLRLVFQRGAAGPDREAAGGGCMSNWASVIVCWSGVDDAILEGSEDAILSTLWEACGHRKGSGWTVSYPCPDDRSTGSTCEVVAVGHVCHFDPEPLLEVLRRIPWESPNQVQLMWKAEEHDRYRVVGLEEKGVPMTSIPVDVYEDLLEKEYIMYEALRA